MKFNELKAKVKNALSGVCVKRLTVLTVLFAFILSVALFTILVATGESIANVSYNLDAFSDVLKSKGQNLDELFDYKFAEVSRSDKELALIYLRKNLKAVNLGFFLYKIKNGENFWTVASKYRINIDTIIGANPELPSLTASRDQEVIVLSRNGVIHEVVDKDEDLQLISELYSVDKEKIAKENGITDGMVRVGDILFIPGAKPVYMTDSLASLYKKRGMFRSPLQGTYTSLLGTRTHPVTHEKKFHDAVDIRAKIGTWVGAAADGTVVYAGWGETLGYYIKIQHADGYSSLYGHLSKIYVRPGQKVKAGRLIAKSGNSGRTTGPHLHFAIYRNGKAQNPLKFLW